jgi:hypothetical protein
MELGVEGGDYKYKYLSINKYNISRIKKENVECISKNVKSGDEGVCRSVEKGK